MSTWTNEKHKAAREAAEGFIAHGGHRIRNITLSDALDEIERLRSLTTITDDKVERGAEALFYTMGQESDGACWISEWEGRTVIDGTFDMPSAVRAALEAALNPPA